MWTQEQRNKFAATYISACKFFDKDISIEMAKMSVDALQDLDFDKCVQALIKHMNVNGKFWPKISDIRSLVSPELDNSDNAKILSLKINEAVSKFGYSNYSKAMEYIGPIGKKVVDRFGGWSYLCENLGSNIQTGMFIAQARDVIYSMQKEDLVINENQIEYRNKNIIESGLQKVDFGSLVSKIEKKYNEK